MCLLLLEPLAKGDQTSSERRERKRLRCRRPGQASWCNCENNNLSCACARSACLSSPRQKRKKKRGGAPPQICPALLYLGRPCTAVYTGCVSSTCADPGPGSSINHSRPLRPLPAHHKGHAHMRRRACRCMHTNEPCMGHPSTHPHCSALLAQFHVAAGLVRRRF